MQSLAPGQVSALIGEIYDCSLDPLRWRATIDKLRDALHAAAYQLYVADARTNTYPLALSSGYEQQWLEKQPHYAAEIVQHVASAIDNGLSLNEPLVVSRILTPEQVARSPYFQEWANPQGLVDAAQVTLCVTPTRTSALAFGRHASAGKFTNTEIDLIRLLVPHVQRAITISNVLEARALEHATFAKSLDALNVDVIVTDEECRVQHCNAAAQQRLRVGDGPFGVRHDRLVMRDDAAQSEVAAAVRQARRCDESIGRLGTAVRLTDDLRDPAVAHVMPLDGGEVRTRLTPATSAAIFVSRPVDDARCARAVADAFALTLAETRVLVPLLATKTTAEIATELRLSPDTVRSHIKSIFAKTGVSRQSELMQLAMSLVSPAHCQDRA